MIEYNLIQKLFLKPENRAKLLRNITVDFNNYKKLFMDAYESMMYSEYFGGKFDVSDDAYVKMIKELEFEADGGWSMKMCVNPIDSKVHIIPGSDIKEVYKLVNTFFNIYGIDIVKYNQRCGYISLEMPQIAESTFIYCNIVPVVGDNYPEVLRNMKEQIRKSKKGLFYMLVYEFNASSATMEEIMSIFTSSGFNVIIVKGLFSLDQRGLTQKEIEYYKIVERVQELEVHNALLLDRLRLG